MLAGCAVVASVRRTVAGDLPGQARSRSRSRTHRLATPPPAHAASGRRVGRAVLRHPTWGRFGVRLAIQHPAPQCRRTWHRTAQITRHRAPAAFPACLKAPFDPYNDEGDGTGTSAVADATKDVLGSYPAMSGRTSNKLSDPVHRAGDGAGRCRRQEAMVHADDPSLMGLLRGSPPVGGLGTVAGRGSPSLVAGSVRGGARRIRRAGRPGAGLADGR